MWSHVYEHSTDLPAEAIWPVIAAVERWPDVDTKIERLTIDEPAAPGVSFTLKPKGGPSLKFTIGRFEPPGVYSDTCRMPGARMETLHLLQADGARTLVRVEVRITGRLARAWGLMVGRRHAAGLPAQTERILERARVIHARGAAESRPAAPAAAAGQGQD